MENQENISYLHICQIVGQLYIESRREIENLASELSKAQRERDDAIRLFTEKNKSNG